MRPYDDQTPLERTMRAYLHRVREDRNRANREIQGHLKREQYHKAAECVDTIRSSNDAVDIWTELLELYEKEFASTRPVYTAEIDMSE